MDTISYKEEQRKIFQKHISEGKLMVSKELIDELFDLDVIFGKYDHFLSKHKDSDVYKSEVWLLKQGFYASFGIKEILNWS